MYVEWFNIQYKDVLIYATPNGGPRGDSVISRKIRGKRLKMSGVVKGVWDLYVTKWFLYIEMKRNDKCKLTPDQVWFREYNEPFGYSFIVCYGFDDAVSKTKSFLDKREVSIRYTKC